MFTFKSFINKNHIWKLCFRDREVMNKLYYENRIPDDDVRVNGLIDYMTSTIYLDKDIDGVLLVKTLRHELSHIYLWETGQQDRVYNEEELCDVMSTAAPLICKATDDIMLRLKEGLYKKGE